MKHTDYQVIGKIVGTHGKYGDLKVFPITAHDERFLDLEHCFVEDGKELKEWTVNGVRLHKGNALVSVDGIDARAEALVLKGKLVYVPKSERIVLDEGQYFLDDLIGCEVCEITEGAASGEKIGKVADFLDHAGNGLLSLSLTNGKSLDVPFVDVYVADVKIDEKLVLVTLRWRDLLDLA